MTPGKTIRIAVLFGLFCISAHHALAATLYWDPTGTFSSSGNGSGTWDTNITADWWISGGTDTTWTDVTGTDTAIFGGAAGTYTVTLAGNETANAITFNSAGYTLSGGTVTLAGTSHTITANANATINSIIAGTAGLTTSGNSALILGGPNTFTGTTTISSGTLQIGNGSSGEGLASTSIADAGALVFNNADSMTYSGAISGAGVLQKLGTGTAVLTGALSYSGSTIVSSGTLSVGKFTVPTHSGGPVSTTVATGATLVATGPITLQGTSSSLRLVPQITGGGTLQFASNSSLASPDIYANTHVGSGYGIVENVNINLGSNTTRWITGQAYGNDYGQYGSGDLGLFGQLTGTNVNVTVQGTGTSVYSGAAFDVVLGNNNSGWSGPLTVVQGQVALANSAALSSANDVYLNTTGSNYAQLYLFGNNVSIGSLYGTGPGTMSIRNGSRVGSGYGTQSNALLTVNQAQNGTFSGVISDGPNDYEGGSSGTYYSLGLIKAGTATLTLTGINKYSGGTTVTAGVLSFGTLGLGSSSSITLSGTSGLQWYGNNTQDITSNGMSLTLSNSALATLDTNGNSVTFNGPILGGTSGGALTKIGLGSLTLNGSVSYTGATTVQQGLLQFGAPSTSLFGPLVVNGGTVALNNTLTAPATTVPQGLLQLNGGSSLQSPLLVSGGSAIVSGAAAVTSGTVQQGLLQLNGGSSLQSPLTLSGGTAFVNNPLSAGPTQTTAIGGGLTVSSPSTITLQAGTIWNQTTPLLIDNGSLTLNSTATINVASLAPLGVGDFELMQLNGGSIGGLGASGLQLGSLPPRVKATLDTTTLPGYLLLDITSFDTIKWSGAVSAEWDTVTPNWVLASSGGTTTYINQPTGDTVTFDDSAKSGAVDLASVLQPSAVTVNNNALPYVFSTSTGTGGITGATYLIKSGSGSLVLATNNNYSGGTFVNGGTLTLGDGVTAGVGSLTGNVTLSNTATGTAVLEFNRPDTLVFPGTVSGMGSLVQAGPGDLIVTGANTYMGSTLVSGGSLQIGNGAAGGSIPGNIVNNAAVIYSRSDSVALINTISGSGTTYVNSGTLQIGNGSTDGSITGPIVSNSLLAFNCPDNLTYAGVISGSGGIAQLGTNTVTLVGSNSYMGPTALSAGILSIGNVAGAGSPSSSANLVFNGGTLQYTGTSSTAAHGVTVTGNGATFVVTNPGQTLTLTGPVSVSGAGGLTMTGPGGLALMGSGTISSGPVTVTAGTLALACNVNTYLNSPMTINAGGVVQSYGQLNLDVDQNGSVGSTNITGSGTLQLMATNSSQLVPDLYFGPDHSGNDYWGAAMNVATLDLGNAQRYIDAKTGHNSVAEYYSSTWTDARISSNIISSGSGGITFYAESAYNGQYAELILGGSNSFTGPVIVNRGAIFLDNPNALTQANAVTLSNNDGTNSYLFLLGNNITISNLQSAGSTPGDTGVANGNPHMSGPAQVQNPATLTINQSMNTTFAGLIADAISDGYTPGSGYAPGSLSIATGGTASLTLTGSNTYSGTTTVSGGVLSLPWMANGGSPSPIGASSNSPGNLIFMGGTLQYTGSGDSTDRLFTLDVAGGTIAASGSGPMNWTNGGSIAFSGTTAQGGMRTLTLCGNNTGPNTMAIPLSDDNMTTTSYLIPTAVVKSGPGTWVMTAANMYTGPTTVQAGQLQFGSGGSLSGPLVVSGGTAVTSDGFAASAGTVQQGLLEFNGPSSGNTLTGPLAVNGGTAVVNGMLTATTTTVQQGVLQLNGGSSLQSPLTLGGGILFVNNPFTAGATQTTMLGAGLTVSAPSTLNLQAGTSWDTSVPLLSGNGNLTVNSTATINLATFGPLSLGDYPLIEMSGGTLNGTLGLSGLKLGILPPRVTAKLVAVNQGGVETLDLDITSFDTIRWTGAKSSAWDTTTLNWVTVNSGIATTYINQPTGDTVTFDDTAKTGSVSLASLVQPSQVTVNNNALNYTLTTSTGTGGISGTAFLTKSGSGSLTLATNNSYSGGTFINGGTMILGDGATAGVGSIVGNVVLSNTATGTAVLEFNRPDTAIFAGNISGAGSLVQAGPGTTILTGSNTFVGSTLISAGALQVGNGAAAGSIPSDPANNTIVNNAALIYDRSDTVVLVNTISGSGTTYINAGTLQLGDGNTIGSISGPIVTNSLLAFNSPSPSTYSGVISGSGGVAQAGINPLTLTASNTYTGSTTVGVGGLVISNVASIGSTTSPANLIFNGGTLEFSGTTTGGIATVAHGLTLSPSGATFQIDNPGQTLTITGPVSGPGGLTNNGPGTLLLTGSGNISGPITANANTQVPSITTAAAIDSYVTIASGAVLSVAGQVTLNANGGGYVTPITGGGTLALIGTNSSIANPDIFANIVSNANWGAQINTAINLGSGSRFIVGHSGNDSYGEYSGDGYGDLGLLGPLYGTASVTVQGLPQNSQFEVALGNDNSGWTGPLTIVQGDVATVHTNALNGNNVTFAPSGGTATTALYLFGQDISIGSLSGTGAGTMWIRNGARSGVNYGQSPSLPPTTGPLGPAVLTVNQAVNGTFAGVISDGPDDYYGGNSGTYYSLGLVKSGTATLTLTGANSYSGPTTLIQGILSVPALANGGALSPMGSSTNSAGNLIFMGGTLQYTGTGASTDRLFTLDVAGGTIAASGSGPLNWTNAGSIAFSGTTAQGGMRTLTLCGSNTGLNTMGIPLSDDSTTASYLIPTAVLKSGPGSWLLSGANTYSGPTTVQQGLLQFASSASLSGPLVVSGGSAVANGSFASTSSATVQQGLLQLYGGSSLQGPLVLSGGTAVVNNPFAAGATQSTTLGGLTVSAPSTLNLQLGTSWDPSVPFFNGNGTIAVTSTATINIGSYVSLSVGSYPLIELTGGTLNGTTGLSGLVLGSLPSRVQATLVPSNQNGTEMVALDVTSVATIKWSGNVSTAWDTTTPNWVAVVTNLSGTTTGSTTYIDGPNGDGVTLDDTAKSGSVSLASMIQPTWINVNNNALNYTISGTGGISGAAYLTKTGSGNCTLATNNSYTGGTTISNGTLNVGDGVTSGVGSIVGAVLLDSTSGSPVLQFNRPDTAIFAGNIVGTGSLAEAGPGTTILTGSNTFVGATLINGGTLQIGNGAAAGSIPSDPVNNTIVNNSALVYDRSDTVVLVSTISGSGTTYVNGGTLQLGDGNTIGSINGPVVTNALLAFNAPSALTYSGVISGSGGIAQVGINPLTLTASNGYTGTTTVGGGGLIISNLANIGSTTSPANIVFNGGTLEYTGSSQTSAHGLSVGVGGATVQIDNPATTLAFTGAATGAGGLTLPGPGSLTVSGSFDLGGPTNVNGGTLALLGNVNTYMKSPIVINSVVQSGATLNLDVNQNGSAASVNVSGDGTLQLVATGRSVSSPDIYFGPDHSGTAYYGAGITVATLDLGSALRYFTSNSGHNSFAKYNTEVDAYISSNIIGSGGLTYTGYSNSSTAATGDFYAELVLAGSNSFSGPVQINQGAIFLDNPYALTQSKSNALTLSASATGWSHFFLFGNNATISNLQSAGSAPGNTGIANGTPTMSESQVTFPVTLTINQTANTRFAGRIADAITDNYDNGGYVPGPLSLVIEGGGTLVLAGSDNYTGGTTVGTTLDAGTLIDAANDAIPDGTSLTVGPGSTLIFDSTAATSGSPVTGALHVGSSAEVVAVPEPGTLVLLAAGALLALVYRKRVGCGRAKS